MRPALPTAQAEELAQAGPVAVRASGPWAFLTGSDGGGLQDWVRTLPALLRYSFTQLLLIMRTLIFGNGNKLLVFKGDMASL